jgi:gamma-glutamyltranspeptidase / glutathione hydrolase
MPHETYATKFGLRPIAYGRRGMVTTANPLATLAGVRMLAHGGNAVDAAIAVAAAIGVTEPYMSGLAGCGTLVLTPPGGAPRALIFLGRAPERATPDRFSGGHPDAGYLAPAVPGNLAGWARVLADYGTLSLGHVLEPAIELAERGIPFTLFDHAMFTESGGRLTPEGVATYCHDGRVPDVGALLVQPDLARTLRRIAAEGIDYLYGGVLGEAIDRLMRERGGLLTLADLRNYPAGLRWTAPIQTTYRGVTVYAPPPPTSAVQALETLNVLETFDFQKLEHLSPDHLAIVAEASRAARLDTHRSTGDPAFVTVPVDRLLSAEHTRELRADVEWRLRVPAPVAAAGGGGTDGGGAVASTTHLAAVDASGLAVNITQSLGHGFGSGVVVPGTGVCLNNAMHWFSMTPGHPNVVAPGKVHEWPVAPLHLHRNGHFWGTIGTPGAYGILVTTVQVLVHLIDFKLNLQDAIAAPRFRWVDDVGDPLPARVMRMESRVPEATRGALATRGYEIDLLGPWSMRVGGVQGTLMDHDTGWIAGAADPRRNGYAIGW